VIFIRISGASISVYGDELLIYNNFSGDTHLISVAIPEGIIKLCFKGNTVNTDVLIEKFYMEFDFNFEKSVLDDFLEKLCQIDILKSVHL
jgi:hypothetical protein